MKGYPAHLATMHDINVAMELDPERTKTHLQRLIDGSRGWFITGSLSQKSDGITDDTHRVVDQGQDGKHDWYQQEFGVLPGNELVRIGLTVEDAEALVQ